jgi:hypothetical protein
MSYSLFLAFYKDVYKYHDDEDVAFTVLLYFAIQATAHLLMSTSSAHFIKISFN